MGIFDFFKKANYRYTKDELTAIPIFTQQQTYNSNLVLQHLQTFWNLKVKNVKKDDKRISFELNDLEITLSFEDKTTLSDNLDNIISRTYVWKTAFSDLKQQTGYAVVSIYSQEKSILERLTLLTQIVCSIMETADACIGVYMEEQSLLLQKDHYLTAINDIQNNRLPIPAWVYIGMINTEGQSNAYTYGMFLFDKPEIEIIGSIFNLNHLYKLILSITSYMIENNHSFKDGDTYSLSENIALKLTYSKGVYTKGKTLKLEI